MVKGLIKVLLYWVCDCVKIGLQDGIKRGSSIAIVVALVRFLRACICTCC